MAELEQTLMPCFHPLEAWQHQDGGELLWRELPDAKPVTVACGQCSGCRLERSRDWATRIMHEAQMHRHNCMVTLTYDNQHLPSDLSLHKNEFPLFIRRLKKALAKRELTATQITTTTSGPMALPRIQHHQPIACSAGKAGVRFYYGGEYGEINGRPHYHACLFGVDFMDKIQHGTTPAGSKLYRSAELTKIWNKGYASVGELNFQSAAYVARYIMKKRTGKIWGDSKTHDHIIDPDSGEIHLRLKEFNGMSRRPGIAATWLRAYSNDVRHGQVIVRGHQANSPRYYDNYIKANNRLAYLDFKDQRAELAYAQRQHHTPERLAVQEQVHHAKIKTLKRALG